MKLKFVLPHNSPKMAKAKEFAGHLANTSIDEELGRHQILCGLSFVGAIAPWHRPSRKCRSVKKTALLLLVIEPLGAHSSAHINCPIHSQTTSHHRTFPRRSSVARRISQLEPLTQQFTSALLPFRSQIAAQSQIELNVHIDPSSTSKNEYHPSPPR